MALELIKLRPQPSKTDSTQKPDLFAGQKLRKSRLGTLDEVKEYSDYYAVKKQVSELLDSLDSPTEHVILYDPIQIKSLRESINKLTDSFENVAPWDFSFKLFGRSFEMKQTSPVRDLTYQRMLLVNIHNALLDPMGESAEFSSFVRRETAHYPKGDAASLKVQTMLELIATKIAMYASFLAGIVTGGIGFLGYVPTFGLLFHAWLKGKESDLASEREKIETIQSIVGSFEPGDEYGRMKRAIGLKAGYFKLSGLEAKNQTEEEDAAGENLHATVFKEHITALITCLEQTDLPGPVKTEMLRQVDQVISNPVTHLDDFNDYLTGFKRDHPADTRQMLGAKAIAAGIALTVFTFGIGFVCFMAYLKHSNTPIKKINTALVDERLLLIQAKAAEEVKKLTL